MELDVRYLSHNSPIPMLRQINPLVPELFF